MQHTEEDDEDMECLNTTVKELPVQMTNNQLNGYRYTSQTAVVWVYL